MSILVLGFAAAFLLAYTALPAVIRHARAKNLLDRPNERSAHTEVTPRLGGVGLFAGLAGSLLFFAPLAQDPWAVASLLAAFALVFSIGILDDLRPVTPGQKVAVQTVATCLLMFGAGVRITSFYGLFGVESLPMAVSAGLTVFCVVAVVNAFNLIDGINGLAGGLAALIFTFLGGWFARAGQADWAFASFALVGAAMAFLRFNLLPRARVFMGDCGSLMLGFACAALGIRFLETGFVQTAADGGTAQPVLAVGLSLMIVPLFDMGRLFFQRLANGKSPFLADRNHVHHLLLDCGLTHLRATGLLLGFNGCLVLLVLWLQPLMGELDLIVLQVAIVAGCSALLYRAATARREVRGAMAATASAGVPKKAAGPNFG